MQRCPDKEEIESILQIQRVKWNRGRLGVIGQGRAGKTALVRAILGLSMLEGSTVGIESFSCETMPATVGEGGWKIDESKMQKLLEGRMATILKEKRDSEYSSSVPSLSLPSATTSRSSFIPSPSINHPLVAQSHVAVDTVPPRYVAFPVNPQVKTQVQSSRTVVDVEYVAMAIDCVDEDELAKCLAGGTLPSNTQVSVIDFGGQDVFDPLHHLFITRTTVYIIVFNIQWLSSRADGTVKSRALHYLRFWIESVVVHTYNPVDKSTSPICLVGTHADIVSSPAEHEDVSLVIYELLKSLTIPPYVVRNQNGIGRTGTMTFQFFPVDNKVKRNQDPMMRYLLSAVDQQFTAAPYVQQEKPITWLKFCDSLKGLQKTHISLNEAMEMAEDCGIPFANIKALLLFLHDMGILMWYDDNGLRDVVILDPIEFFVKAVTSIIRKHEPSKIDGTHHFSELHEKCARLLRTQWTKFTRTAVLDDELLSMLLEPWREQRLVITQLMIKYGLLVAVIHKNRDGVESKQYIVPALLPESVAFVPNSMSFKPVNNCILAFFGDEEPLRRGYFSKDVLVLNSFLPAGLFARLLGKLIGWSQETSLYSTIDTMDLSIGSATLRFGSQTFRIIEFPREKYILLEIEGMNPCAVQKQVMELASRTVQECSMSILHCQCLLPFKDEGFVVLSALTASMKESSPLPLPGGRSLAIADANARFRRFLPISDKQCEYDVFLSYRWDEATKDFTSKVSDSMTTRSVGANKRQVFVFLDRERLRKGENFKKQFANALLSSSVIVPFISIKAIRDLVWHDPSVKDYDPNWEDNVLIEWILALEGQYSRSVGLGTSRVEKIYPIFMGEKDAVTGMYDDMKDDHKDLFANIPDVVPFATIRRARGLLVERGIEPRESLSGMTVKGIVAELREGLGFKLKDVGDPLRYVSQSCQQIYDVLQDTSGIEELSVAEPEISPEVGSPAVGTTTRERWKDNNTPTCERCKLSFSMFRWRHHCRLCCMCVCQACSSKTLVVHGKQERVCDACFEKK